MIVDVRSSSEAALERMADGVEPCPGNLEWLQTCLAARTARALEDIAAVLKTNPSIEALSAQVDLKALNERLTRTERRTDQVALEIARLNRDMAK